MTLPTCMTVFAAMFMTVAASAQSAGDSPYQIRYASNLATTDYVINISNSGAAGAGRYSAGTMATVTGALCANIYAFNADEEIIACCSCPVTPDGLVSFDIKTSLLSNSFSIGTPSSVVIKLLATAPQGGTCAGSAALATGAPPLLGLVSWIRSVPAATSTTCPVSTDASFTPATLSAGEYNRLGSLCSLIMAQGSGTGICNACPGS
jgi:hypothetical protein